MLNKDVLMKSYLTLATFIFLVLFSSHAFADVCSNSDKFSKVTGGVLALSAKAQAGGYFYQGRNDEEGAPGSYHYVLVKRNGSISGNLNIARPSHSNDGEGFNMNLTRGTSALGSLSFHTGTGVWDMAADASDLTVNDFKRAFGSNASVSFQCGGEDDN
jgi:hypothetical protein